MKRLHKSEETTMCEKNKQEFNREEMLRVCTDYYMKRGYSEEHSYKYVAQVSDSYLQSLYDEICNERDHGVPVSPRDLPSFLVTLRDLLP